MLPPTPSRQSLASVRVRPSVSLSLPSSGWRRRSVSPPARAPDAESAASSTKAASVPPASATGGTASAPMKPPIGIAVPEAQGEAAFVRAEPVHDGAAARGVDARARSSRERDHEEEE